MSKEEIMKQLLDLYEQRKYVSLPATQIIIDGYVRKLELMLVNLLK